MTEPGHGCQLARQLCCRPRGAARHEGARLRQAALYLLDQRPACQQPGHGHYSASKAGIIGFIRAAALEFSGYRITVNGVEPGNIMTESMLSQRFPAFIKSMESPIPLGRLGSERDVGNAISVSGIR